MTKTSVGSDLVAGPGASLRILGMPLGRHALSVECLKPWTVAAEHSVEDGLWTYQIRVGDSPLVRHALSVECLKTRTVAHLNTHDRYLWRHTALAMCVQLVNALGSRLVAS